MATNNESWGIDVGSSAVKAVKLVRSGGEVRMEHFEILKYKEVLTAPDVDREEAIQLQLDALVQKHGLENAHVVASVPGNMAFARFASLPPVEPKKIPDIVKFEAQQQIPFPIEEVEWDYQVFQEEDSPDVKVGIFAITKERVMQFLSNYRAVGVQVDELTLSPVAVFNAFSYELAESGGDGGTVFLDIGSVSTDVIVIEDGQIWLRTLPIGGNNFTEALVKQFKISYAKAEKLKKEAATSKYAKQIFQAMRSVFADLVQEVQRSIGYYQSMNRDSELERIVGLGSTFKLPGLQKFLKQQLQLDVSKPQPFARVEVDGKRESELAGAAGNLSTAYGLALQGLGLETVSANILPAHILKQRLWKAKQPWIAAAAAAVALASGLYAAKYFVDRAAFDQSVQATQSTVASVTREAQKWQSEAQAMMVDNPLQIIENYNLVLPQRDLYAHVTADIAAMLASVQPQEALLAGDAEAIKAIPRDQRRQLVIDVIADEYIANEEPVAEADPSASAGMGMGMGYEGMGMGMGYEGMGGYEDMGMGMGYPGAGGGAAGGGAPGDVTGMVADGASKEFFSDTSKPKLNVVLRGTTPYGNPSQLINSTVIQWLRSNADRPDAPYTIELDDNPIPYIRPVAGGRAGVGGNTYSSQPMGGGLGMGAGMGGYEDMGGGMGGGMGMGYPGGGGTRSFTGSNASVGEMLPQNPLLEEDRTGDNAFEIRFTLVLKNPVAEAEADAAETPLEPDPAAEPDQARATDPAPEPDAPASPEPATDLSANPAALLDEVNS